MLQAWVILLVSFAYLCLLFAIAYHGDRRADQGRSLINNPYIYSLSIAVYCTSWTFYGSVGWAATSGVGFLPIYLGPTLMAATWWFILRKIVRISKVHRITSIADFISSRYGKSAVLSGLVTVIAVIGIMPYISLQLKAVSTSFNVLQHYPEIIMPTAMGKLSILADTAFYVALLMATFAIVFGTRHIDAAEHHEGMVAAIAFEAVVKLVAFLAVGMFVTFGLYSGFGDLFTAAAKVPEIAAVFTIASAIGYGDWVTLTLLSMAAIICLPRQFQVAVVENVNEDHVRTAAWLFPLYLLAINVFVLPIALAGLLHFRGGAVDADTFVLTLPMAEGREALALFAYIGGLSAATGMVIVAAITLSTMVCNDLVMPVLLRLRRLHLTEREDLSGLLLAIRRGSIGLVLLFGYLNLRLIGESYALVTIGLVSFAAAAQFAPALIGGIFWKSGSREGALIGLTAGFIVWGYTLLLPSFARSGWLPVSFIEQGPFGIALLRPYEMFGLHGFGHISHSLFWSLLLNVGAYVGASGFGRQNAAERLQATLFVDVYRHSDEASGSQFWRGTTTVTALHSLLARFTGLQRANQTFAEYARSHLVNLEKTPNADPTLVDFTERTLAGAIGSASARVMVASVVKGEFVSTDQVMQILDETSQIIEYSRQLEQKSTELNATNAELRQTLDKLKHAQEQIIVQEKMASLGQLTAGIAHEIKNPLNFVNNFAQLSVELAEELRQELNRVRDKVGDDASGYLDGILNDLGQNATKIVEHGKRADSIVRGMLSHARGTSGDRTSTQLNTLLEEDLNLAYHGMRAQDPSFNVTINKEFDAALPKISVVVQEISRVFLNLLSNACYAAHDKKVSAGDSFSPTIWVGTRDLGEQVEVRVRDNGSGIPKAVLAKIFTPFFTTKPSGKGTGLGLSISYDIVTKQHGGTLRVETQEGEFAEFIVTLPKSVPGEAAR